MINVVFWPNFQGLQGRMDWFETAFPRTSCKWWHEFTDFHFDNQGHEPNFDAQGAIVVINGASIGNRTLQELNDSLLNFKWVMLVSNGDEGSGLHLEHIRHPRMSVWVYDPKPGKHDKYHRLPSGPIHEVTELVPRFQYQKKERDWFFSGSKRDVKWDAAIQKLPNGKFYSDHLSFEGYVQHLATSKVVPCRPTYATPETCRVYDALELGSVPIVGIFPAEAVCHQCKQRDVHPHVHLWWTEYNFDWTHYWEYVLGESAPFPVVYSPENLEKTLQDTLSGWPDNARRLSIWWERYKVKLVESLRAEVRRLQQ